MHKKDTLNLMMASIVVGAGLASGQPIVAALLGGIGINWASDIIWSAWEQVRDQWFGINGVLRDDIAEALDRALANTVSLPNLADEFKATEEYKTLNRQEVQAANKALKFVQESLTNPFSESKVNTIILDKLGLPFTTPAVLQAQLNEYVTVYLRGNNTPEVLIQFVQQRLSLDNLTAYFVEDLKQDTQLWRSQQLIFAQSYLTSLSRLEQGQTEILNRLDAFISANHDGEKSKDYSPLPKFSNEVLLQQAIAKLLTFMPGITDVRILQRGSQQGKDIVFVGNGPLGDRINCACLVKNIAISGEVGVSSGARTVLQQVNQALDTSYTDHNGVSVQVQKVYVISPYEIAQTAIESIEGALQRMSGQTTFIGGTELFRLFKEYWPDYFIDEADALENYVEHMRKNIGTDNPIEAVAAFYRLGAVSEVEKQIYVPLGFLIKFCTYTLANPLNELLPSDEDITRRCKREDVNRALRSIRMLATIIQHLSAWDFWDDQFHEDDPESLRDGIQTEEGTKGWQQVLDELFEALNSSWDTAARKQVGRKDSDPVPNFAQDVKLKLANQQELFRTLGEAKRTILLGTRHLRNDLQEFSKLARSTSDDISPISPNLTHPEVKRLLSLQSCIEALPSRFFLPSQSYNICLPKNLPTVSPLPFLIVGPPGSGKSTFCRWNALRDAESLATETYRVVPVYVPLHRIVYKEDWDLQEHLMSRTGRSALLCDDAKTLWESGDATLRIYLDGLDEIAKLEIRNTVIEQAKTFCEANRNVQIIVTSRDYVRFPGLSWLNRVSLAGLSDDDIANLVEQWLSPVPGLVYDFYTQLNDNKMLKSLMTTPLLATLILLVFKHTRRLPSSKVRLYDVFIELLCGGWDQAKNLPREQRFGSDIKLMILTELAGINHLKGIREFGQLELRTAARRILREIDKNQLNVLLAELIEDGVITGGAGNFEFSHFSFQEFLAARFLAGDPNTSHARKALKDLAVEKNDWWREALRFYAGLMEPRSFTQWLIKELDGFSVPSSESLDIFSIVTETHPSFDLTAYISVRPND